MIINVCLQGVTRLRELQEPPAPGVQLLQRSQLLLSALHWVNLAEKSFIRIHIHIFFWLTFVQIDRMRIPSDKTVILFFITSYPDLHFSKEFGCGYAFQKLVGCGR